MSWEAAAGGAAMAANYFSQQSQNIWNAKEAKKNREWQERMSSTAHQREVKDLRKAGLNPILSANSGASSPGGATASGEAPQLDFDPMLAANAKQVKAQTEATKASTKNTEVDTGLKAANTKSAEKSWEISDATKKLLQAQTAKEGEMARMSKINADLDDKYGNASRIMGLINSGTGSIGNLMSIGNAVKNIGNLFGNKNKTVTTEHYSRQGEHLGTKSVRTTND